MRDLRMGVFDVLVGINLLREGLDIPECALVGILDADKEGFLRSETSLIQTIGRAAWIQRLEQTNTYRQRWIPGILVSRREKNNGRRGSVSIAY